MSSQSKHNDQQHGNRPVEIDPASNAEKMSGPSDPGSDGAVGGVTVPEALDALDEAEYESFPASDPPSYTGSAATPSVPKKAK